MHATDFEFRNRFWIIMLLFSVAFASYGLDHVNVMQAVADWIAGLNNSNSDRLVRFFLALGTILVFIAASIRTWAAAYLRSEVVHDANVHSEALVADGPYRHVRNPLYFGNFLVAAGIGCLASRLGFVILILGMTVVVLRLIGREEAQLEKEQGERFREFCRNVPRLWPALRPRLPSGGVEPHWGQAFIGEAFNWGAFIALLVFDLTLNNTLLWAILATGLLSRILLGFVEKRPLKAVPPS